MTFRDQFVLAKNASRSFASLSAEEKNNILFFIADALESAADCISLENQKDLAAFSKGPMADRLMLDNNQISNIAHDVRNVASLPDEIGAVLEQKKMPNGLDISQVRVPLGVVGMIYESRPNVTVDASVLCLKSGNAVVLKGGKEAISTNRILVRVMKEAIEKAGYDPNVIQFLDSTDRSVTTELLQARGLIDVVIPRGGKGLIGFAIENATVPVIETGASVVHTFVDASADLRKALDIVANEKLRRVSVCNALDTVLVHASLKDSFLPLLANRFLEESQKNRLPLVKIHADKTALPLMANVSSESVTPLSESDFSTEWLDYEMNVVVVSGIDDAIAHIQKYSLGHSESICSQDTDNIEQFLREIDAACVYANASTCFSDGAQFGLGAEIGISTQKLHVRGPFALRGLTSTKWIIRGKGHIRP